MDKNIETYINQIVNELSCDPKEKKDIVDEMKDHLNSLKNEYIEQGFTEKEAIQEALRSFGEFKQISHGYKKFINPNYKIIKQLTWILFTLYSFVALWNLLFVRLIDRIINNNSYNRYFLFPQNHQGFFDIEVWKLNSSIIPFKNTINYINGSSSFNVDIIINNTIGNLLIFLPIGIFLPILFKKYIILSQVITSSIILSFTIEILQFTLRIGQFDVDDILLNTLGAILGCLIVKLICKFTNLFKRNLFQETKN
ncbi:VanZ family protein [Bacillus sp. AFS017336]|uniref:VanZ family protein n=1 Tax=Bacillus sp. AFS017336 TaxID=2033489 RepID=UPI000BF18B4C|nr:VanZ family protein [Bacillus sp. AFS017336]PEL08421.1 VanZ family protein [Bacillus sp. AFS017336]